MYKGLYEGRSLHNPYFILREERLNVFRVGELVRWRCPLDADYSYGKILEIKRSIATVNCTGYYAGMITEVHLKYIEKMEKGGDGFGNSKKSCKYSITRA